MEKIKNRFKSKSFNVYAYIFFYQQCFGSQIVIPIRIQILHLNNRIVKKTFILSKFRNNMFQFLLLICPENCAYFVDEFDTFNDNLKKFNSLA